MTEGELRSYWIGVVAGVERFAYWWRTTDGVTKQVVGPHGTTTLEEAIEAVLQEQRWAMKAWQERKQDGATTGV